MAGMNMSSLTSLTCILSFILFVSATDPVPVLLWQSYSGGSLSASSSALRSLSSTEFSDILLKKIADSKPLVLIFAEKALSVEDFTWIGSDEERPFSQLEKLYSSAKSKLYVPDVNGPITAVLNLKEHDYKFEYVPMGEEIAPGNKRVVIVNLDSERPGESRAQMLKRHDDYIASVYNEMASKSSSSKILAAYTGQNFAWKNIPHEDENVPRSRVRRAVGKEVSENSTLLLSSTVYLYSPSPLQITYTTGEKKTINLSNVIGTPTSDNRKTGDSTLRAKFSLPNDSESYVSLEFEFHQGNGMWNLTQVNMTFKDQKEEDVLVANSSITAPVGFSYHCSRTETFTGKNAILQLVNPQIQPYASNNTFGPTSDCVYFFSASILSGLLLTVLLLAITSWGIAMIMGIHTMDRFDDPKGKPLFINASE